MGRHESSRSSKAAALALLAAIVGFPEAAQAFEDEEFVSFGPLFSLSGHKETPIWFGVGAEATYVRWQGKGELAHGWFVHVELIGLDHFRFGIGPQVNTEVVGTEIGLVVETADQYEHDTTLFFHIGPFASVGYASASARFDIPIPLGTSGYGVGWGGGLALKYVGELQDGELQEIDLWEDN